MSFIDIKRLPNQLTVARIVMIFIFLFLANVETSRYINVSTYIEHICSVAAVIIAFLAATTDFFDGYIARKFHVESDFGKLMDPLADKVFITATFIMTVEKGFMPAWIAVVVISREFLVTGLRLLAVKKGEVISADRLGKLKTLLQMSMLFFAGLGWIHIINLHAKGIQTVWDIVLLVIAVITVWSGVNYFVRYRHLYLDET